MATPHPTSDLSRRTLVTTVGWCVPTAAGGPAVAAAPATAWTIRSSSWEGAAGGTRDDEGTVRMRFTIAVPSGTLIKSPMATLQLGLMFGFDQVRAGDGTAAGGWTTTRELAAGEAWGRFVYTHGHIAGPATIDLDFDLTGLTLLSGSTTTIGTLTFTSATPVSGATHAFTVLASNRNRFVTSPPA